ncbi:MAG: double-strand break repair protein AddB [Robiginitomaculum sp.]
MTILVRPKPVLPADIFKGSTPNIYTMPASIPFLPALARGLKQNLGDDLVKTLVLLPTRRSARDLSEAFLALSDGKPTFLPLMRTLADMDENEPPFEPGDIAATIPASIDTTRRRFELARLVAAKLNSRNPDAAGALAMSEPLISILNDMALEELSAGALSKIDDDLDKLPKHFQDAAKFLQIISTHWPDHLSVLGLSDPMARRVDLLNAAAKSWQEKPPAHPVIIAGSTGSLAATARLIHTVSKFDKGCIILPGLDTHIDSEVWEEIDEQHPQASLKTLLKTLGTSRAEVPDWPIDKLKHKAQMRARILSESLIPANQTSDWPSRIKRIRTSIDQGDPLLDGLDGLSLLETKNEEEEAAVIALIMRETLETKDKTCALVTPDPSLARRVRARLSRWNIEIDSSAGEPLEETLHGTFLSLSLDAALDMFNPVVLSALVQHKFCAFMSEHMDSWNAFETLILRGPRARTYDAIERRFARCKNRTDTHVFKCAQQGYEQLKLLHALLKPLHNLSETKIYADKFTRVHIELTETLARGPEAIWREEAGEKAAALLEEVLVYGDMLPPLNGIGYQRLLSTMMRGLVVRPRYGTQAQLKILGPLEARMLDADTIILGALNEGIWPARPAPHPVLSRGMRKQIGLSAPERRFGLSAHDFASLACKPNVILTRSKRQNNGPSVMSRWLWRLTTLVRGGLGEKADQAFMPANPYLKWARELDVTPTIPSPATPPEPRPSLDKRWPEQRRGRRLSVTQISKWIRNPYGIYASKILGLESLDGFDEALGGREYGLALHKALEWFSQQNNVHDTDLLLELFKKAMMEYAYEDHSFARYHPRLQSIAKWVVKWLHTRREEGWKLLGAEQRGVMVLEMPGGNFTLSGIADRLEIKNKTAAILDYKTGSISTKSQVQAGLDPQLPLMATMLNAGQLGAKAHDVSDLLYIKPNAKKEQDKTRSLLDKDWDIKRYQEGAIENLQKLIVHFDDKNTAYYCQPRAQYVDDYSDYDHLARRLEWAKIARGEE